jgi:hypothetical protein
MERTRVLLAHVTFAELERSASPQQRLSKSNQTTAIASLACEATYLLLVVGVV